MTWGSSANISFLIFLSSRLSLNSYLKAAVCRQNFRVGLSMYNWHTADGSGIWLIAHGHLLWYLKTRYLGATLDVSLKELGRLKAITRPSSSSESSDMSDGFIWIKSRTLLCFIPSSLLKRVDKITFGLQKLQSATTTTTRGTEGLVRSHYDF